MAKSKDLGIEMLKDGVKLYKAEAKKLHRELFRLNVYIEYLETEAQKNGIHLTRDGEFLKY